MSIVRSSFYEKIGPEQRREWCQILSLSMVYIYSVLTSYLAGLVYFDGRKVSDDDISWASSRLSILKGKLNKALISYYEVMELLGS